MLSSCVKNKEMSNLYATYGIKHKIFTPYKPSVKDNFIGGRCCSSTEKCLNKATSIIIGVSPWWVMFGKAPSRVAGCNRRWSLKMMCHVVSTRNVKLEWLKNSSVSHPLYAFHQFWIVLFMYVVILNYLYMYM